MQFRPDDVGLVALVRTNSSTINRLSVQNHERFHVGLPIMRQTFERLSAHLAPELQPEVIKQLWALALSEAMDMPETEDPRRRVQMHMCGLGLLRELGFANVFVSRAPGDVFTFHELTGSPREAYDAVERWMDEQHTRSRSARRRKR